MRSAAIAGAVLLLLAAALAACAMGRHLGVAVPPVPSMSVPSYVFSFTVFYVLWLAVTACACLCVAPQHRDVPLLASGVAFLVSAVDVPTAACFVVGMAALHGVLSRGRPSGLAFAVWLCAFYIVVPRLIMRPDSGLEAAADFVDARNLVRLGLVLRSFRRAVFAFYERRVGRADPCSLVTFLNYAVGLPFLIGNGATPSLQHFLTCRAEGPLATRQVVVHGLRTVAVCLLCLVGWSVMRDLLRDMARSGASDRGVGWLLLTNQVWFFKYYFHRMSTEQLSVGMWRVLGWNMRDDFAPNVLLSGNFVEFWRRWNVLWRELLMSLMYYPILMRLVRRGGATRPWMLGVAAFLTFVGSTVFLVFPKGFLYGGLSPEVRVFAAWLLVYHVTWGALLGGNLALQAALGGRWRSPRWLTPLKIALTLGIAAACRSFSTLMTAPDKMTALDVLTPFDW